MLMCYTKGNARRGHDSFSKQQILTLKDTFKTLSLIKVPSLDTQQSSFSGRTQMYVTRHINTDMHVTILTLLNNYYTQ